MAGYAYPVGAAGAEYPAHTVQTIAVPQSVLFDNYEGSGQGFILGSIQNPVTKKTRVNSLFLNNNSGGILPVEIWRGSSVSGSEYIIVHSTRVLKNKFAILPLVSEDSRVSGVSASETILTEIVLDPGDYLAVVCPVADAVIASANISIGVK